MRVKIFLFVSVCSMISIVFTSNVGAEVYDDFNGSEINPDLWQTHNNASGLLYQSGGFLRADSPPYLSSGAIDSDSKMVLYGDFEVIVPWDFFAYVEPAEDPPGHLAGMFGLNVNEAFVPSGTNGVYILRSHGGWPVPHGYMLSNIYVDGVSVAGKGVDVSAATGLFKITRVGLRISVLYDIGAGWIVSATAPNAFTCPVTFHIYAETGDSGWLNFYSDWIEIYASPRASFEYLPLEPMVGGKIEFDASDSQGNIVDYKWDFDDGELGNGSKVEHIFKEPKIYDVNLTVTDADGLTDSNSMELNLTLENGDLFLCRDEDSFFGKLGINFWTHVGIYHQPSNMIIEARAFPDWVVAFYPLSDWFFPDKTYVEVLRVEKTSQGVRNAAVDFAFAQAQVGKSYDLFTLLINGTKNKDDSDGLGWYCSELVWAAYWNASGGGIDFDPDMLTVSPDEINNSNHTEFRGAHMEDCPDTVWTRYFWGQASCPVDLEITDPDGLVLNKQGSQIPGGVYQEFDLDGDDDLDDFFAIPEPKEGDYLIHVIPEPGALPTDTFTLEVTRNGAARVLAQDVQVQNIPEIPYVVTDLANISADVQIEPETLNLSSEGKWITCYIELPEAYDESDIDVGSLLLEYLLEVQHSDVQDDVLMVKFDRQDVIAYIELVLEIELPADVTLMVTGELTDGTPFEGSDTIRVIE